MNLVEELKKVDIIKYGDYILKSGKKSNIYINLKDIVTFPTLLYNICQQLSLIALPLPLCGVPLGGIPFTLILGQILNLPCIIVRDDIKTYGMQKQIEGQIVKEVVLVEDVVTSGQSVLKTINLLNHNDISVKQILVVVDREEGGVDALRHLNYKVDVLLKISQF